MEPRVARALSVGATTLVLAVFVNFVSKILLGRVGLVLGLFILLAIVSTGVMFDVIGTATTAAKRQPFNAMAAKRVYGARVALRMLGSADRVASFCNDVVGDMAGTVSGAVGASIVLRLAAKLPAGIAESVLSALVIGIIAALTVGGKAWSKNIAVNEAERIVLSTAKVLAWIEGTTGITFLSRKRSRYKRRGREGYGQGRREGDSGETP